MVGLPLILGLIAYIVIILALTFWLVKYHSFKCRCYEAKIEKNSEAKQEEQGLHDVNTGI
jgi:hypothetical protein